ncbi:AraC family transcriptional regulator [Pseudomonas aeruginosa]|nr:AraC family transcriptional regulator [Pseudomonas aeruginosa]
MSRRTDSDAPTITAAYPRLLLGLLEERGLDGRALLREIGLSTLRLEEPEARVTSQQYQAIAATALALSGDPGLGAQLALRTPPTAHGSLGYAMMASATLGDALCLALRYMPLLLGNVEISLLREDEQVILRLLPGPALPPALHRYFSEALLIGLCRSGAWLLGEPALVGRLDFDYPEPAVPVPLPQCRYDQAHVQLVFPAILLARSLPMADPAALRRAREHCERELALLDAGRRDICARVRLELERQEQRFPNLEEVAARLHLSSRSLKRHLHDAGTSFRQLLGQARQRQALRLLRRPEVSLQRIALYLGYSDPTNFTRAFKRWTGEPPSDTRARLLGGQPVSRTNAKRSTNPSRFP